MPVSGGIAGPLASERWWKQSGPQTGRDFGMFAAFGRDNLNPPSHRDWNCREAHQDVAPFALAVYFVRQRQVNSLTRRPEFAGHLYQPRRGICPHLLHDLPSVRFYRDLADAQFSANLLVQQPGDY